LFSVRGTPVLTTGTSMSMLEAKKREAVVQSVGFNFLKFSLVLVGYFKPFFGYIYADS